MRVINFDPKTAGDKYVLQIHQGGTGGDTNAKAIANLGGIRQNQINSPGGVAGLDSNGFIDPRFIPADLEFSTPLNLDGPESILVGETKTILITNFDSFTDYSIQYEGVTGYRADDKIFVTAAARGNARVIVNGSIFPIPVLGNMPIDDSIVGGDLLSTIALNIGTARTGTRVKLLDNLTYIVGSPEWTTRGASQVGRVDVLLPSGATITYPADPGPLQFSATMGEGGQVKVTSNGENDVEQILDQSGQINIPVRSTYAQFQGRGGNGRTVWVPGTPGKDTITYNDPTLQPFPEKTRITIKGRETTPLSNGVYLERQMEYWFDLTNNLANNQTLAGVLTVTDKQIYPNGDASSNTPVSQGTGVHMFFIGDSLNFNLESKGLVSKLDFVSITIQRTTSGQVEHLGWSEYPLTTAEASAGLMRLKTLKCGRTMVGQIDGTYSNAKGSDTTVAGYAKSLTWVAGTGSSNGHPVPELKGLLCEGDYRVLLEFTNTDTSTSGTVVSSPRLASDNPILKPLSFGYGIDTIERKVRWTRYTIGGQAGTTSDGWVRMIFGNGKIKIEVILGESLDFILAQGYNLTIVKNGQRTSFPLTLVSGGEVKTFEIAGFLLAQGEVAQSGMIAPEVSSKTLQTVQGSLFGTIFDVSLENPTLVVGIGKEPLTDQSQLVAIRDYLNTPSVQRLGVPDTQQSYGQLTDLRVSSDAKYVAAAYPDFNSRGGVALYQFGSNYQYLTTLADATLTNGVGFGSGISFTGAGAQLAVGIPGVNQVRIYDNAQMVTESSRITGPLGFTYFGSYVKISKDGTRIAIRALDAQSIGVVFIYERHGGSWAQKAKLTQGTESSATNSFGVTFDGDDDLNMLAVSAPGLVTSTGRVYLYFNGTETWEHYKTLGLGSEVGYGYGRSLSVSPDAKTLLVGEPGATSATGRATSYAGTFQFLS